MFSTSFALRRLFRHWRLNLAVLFGLTLASALLAILPSFAEATAENSLKQAIEDAPPIKRNIQVDGPSYALNAPLHGYVNETIGELNPMRLVVRQFRLQPAEGEFTTWLNNIEPNAPHSIGVWSIDKMQSTLQLIEGTWPVHSEPQSQAEALKPPVIQAVIDHEVYTGTKLKIGDTITEENKAQFRIVGIVERLDPEHDIWWGDDFPFKVVYAPMGDFDAITIPVFINQTSMKAYFDRYDVHWRIVLDTDQISVDNVQSVEDGLINLKTRLESNSAKMASGLPNLLLEYRSDLASARMAMFLLSTQAIIFTLYTLTLIASLLLERLQSEMATLASRGASSFRISLTFAIEALPLALLAGALLGPLLARASLEIWSWVSSESVSAGFPLESRALALAGALLGWLAVVIPAYPAARHSLLEWQHQVARPKKSTWWQRIYLDVFLLIFSIVLYWQLSSSGSFVIRRFGDSNLSDPILLLSPTILIIAIALLFLRLFPLILGFFSWLTKNSRGIVIPLGLTRLARDPIRPSRVVLLISLAAALTLFARAFSDTLTRSQIELAHYRAGADIRIKTNNPVIDNLTTLPGVQAITPVFRGLLQRNDGTGINLIAIDTESFPKVSRYPGGMSGVPISTIARVVNFDPSQIDKSLTETNNNNPYTDPENIVNGIPTIFSHDALPSGVEIGESLNIYYFGNQIPVEVRGIIVDFPTLDGAFVIMDQNAIRTILDIDSHRFSYGWEAWINTDTSSQNNLIGIPEIEDNIMADSSTELRALQRDALTKGAVRAFGLNAFFLTVLSLTGFILVTYFAAQKRTYEFGVLRANGISKGQLLRLLATEGLLIMSLGLVSGTILGYILAAVMRPYLTQAIARDLPGTTTYQVWLNIPEMTVLYIILIGSYTLAILLLLSALMRIGIHKTLRLGDE
jgi:putative ABC transport system permease protein